MDSAKAQIDEARGLLKAGAEVRVESPWAALGAAMLTATAAVLLAGMMILGPGMSIDDAQPAAAFSTQ